MAEAPDEMVVKVRAEFDPAIEDVKRLTLRPGDTLVIVLGDSFSLTQDNVERLNRYVQRMGLEYPVVAFPSGTKLAVIGPDDVQAEAGASEAPED